MAVSCRLLSGEEVLTVQPATSRDACRRLVARRLGVREETVHLLDGGGRFDVLLCASFKVLCRGCSRRVDCACDEPEPRCACTLVQDWAARDDYCPPCRREEELEVHWCAARECIVCSEDWFADEEARFGGGLARLKRRARKKAAAALRAAPELEETE